MAFLASAGPCPTPVQELVVRHGQRVHVQLLLPEVPLYVLVLLLQDGYYYGLNEWMGLPMNGPCRQKQYAGPAQGLSAVANNVRIATFGVIMRRDAPFSEEWPRGKSAEERISEARFLYLFDREVLSLKAKCMIEPIRAIITHAPMRE